MPVCVLLYLDTGPCRPARQEEILSPQLKVGCPTSEVLHCLDCSFAADGRKKELHNKRQCRELFALWNLFLTLFSSVKQWRTIWQEKTLVIPFQKQTWCPPPNQRNTCKIPDARNIARSYPLLCLCLHLVISNKNVSYLCIFRMSAWLFVQR